MKIKSLTTSIILLIFAQFQSFAQIIPAYVPQNGLVGWYPFNGNANDESANSNNGTVIGASLTSDRFGFQNNAYSFLSSSNNYISADIGILDSDITFSGWYNAPSPNKFYPRLFYYGEYPVSFNSSQFDMISAGIMGNEPSWINNNFTGRFYTETNISNSGINQPLVTSDSQWHFFTIVVETQNSLLKLYIDGLFINSTPLGQNSINAGSVFFGRDPGDNFGGCNTCGRYNGKLDDIGIWNRALNQQEITSLYTGCNLNASVSPSSLTGQIQQNVLFNGSANSGSFVWQTNPNDIGWTNVPTNSTYSGQSSSTLGINNLQLSNHNQPFRLIATDGECIDTSDVAYIQILDTCVSSITTYDTIYVAVEDTLNINTTITSVSPSQTNTFKVYPNPASTQLTIDNGNLSLLNGYSISIQNSLGQEVFNQPITQQVFIIDLNTWTGSGIYHLNILDNLGNVIENKKIVLQ